MITPKRQRVSKPAARYSPAATRVASRVGPSSPMLVGRAVFEMTKPTIEAQLESGRRLLGFIAGLRKVYTEFSRSVFPYAAAPNTLARMRPVVAMVRRVFDASHVRQHVLIYKNYRTSYHTNTLNSNTNNSNSNYFSSNTLLVQLEIYPGTYLKVELEFQERGNARRRTNVVSWAWVGQGIVLRKNLSPDHALSARTFPVTELGLLFEWQGAEVDFEFGEGANSRKGAPMIAGVHLAARDLQLIAAALKEADAHLMLSDDDLAYLQPLRRIIKSSGRNYNIHIVTR